MVESVSIHLFFSFQICGSSLCFEYPLIVCSAYGDIWYTLQLVFMLSLVFPPADYRLRFCLAELYWTEVSHLGTMPLKKWTCRRVSHTLAELENILHIFVKRKCKLI